MAILMQAFLFCMMMSCSKTGSSINNNNMDSIPTIDTTTKDTTNAKAYSWLALGDSYTIGQSVDSSERYPSQTISLLQHDSLNFNNLQYIATTGWTTQNLLDAITQQNPPHTFDIVSLLIGVNDQYQHRDTTGYREKFTECLQQAIRLANNNINHVFVISIPDYSVTPFASGSDTAMIRQQIDEFNAINKEVTLSFNINYTYITELTREAKTDNSLIAPDGLHPSGKEYAKWAALLALQIEKVLK